MLFSKYKIILLFAFVFSFGFSSQSIFGQTPMPTPCSIKDSNCPNGIGVGDIKVFDNRSLTLQLEGLEKILQQINVIDQKSLSDSLGLRQGSQSSEVSRSLQLGTPPIPGITTTRKPDANGDLNISEEITTKKEISANSPTVPEALTAPKDEARFGTQSENLLQQQIDLTYKIYNLRLLLERSLTDRLTSTAGDIFKKIPSSSFTGVPNGVLTELTITETGHGFSTGFEGRFTTTVMLPKGLSEDEDYYVIRVDANTFKLAKSFTDALKGKAILFGDQGTGTHTFTSRDGGSKLQTVLGFNVSLDPQKVVKDMAAFVELTVTTSDGTPVSVVSLMPEQKTYNTSALSTKSNAFGGSAVFKVISVGYSERRRGQTYYLYQDADTVTYRKPAEDGSLSNGKPTFGWQFRPVLGRRSVANDPRNLFVVLSVDKRDLVNISESTTLQVKVKTYWKKYDHKTQTVDNAELYPRSPKEVTASAFSTAKYQAKLSPNITKVKWNQLDEKNGVLSIEGENFFTGTNVLIGNTVLDNPTNGLTIKSDQSLQIRTTLDAIASGDVVINGRYGVSQAILAGNKNLRVKAIKIDEFSVRSISDKTSRLCLTIVNKEIESINRLTDDDPAKGQLTKEDLIKYGFPPVVSLNSIRIPVVNAPQNIICNIGLSDGNTTQKNCVLLIVDVPSSLVSSDALVTFKVPLLGQEWASSMQLYYDPKPSNVKLTKLSDDTGKSTFSITGNELNQLTITNSLIKPSLRNNKLITFDLTDAQIKLVKNIILLTASNEPFVLEIPDSLPKPPKPTLTNTDIPQMSINSSKTVTFKGEGLDQITKAFFEDKELQIVKKSKTEITVLLTRDVTKEAGDVEIILKKDINDKEPVIGKVLILDKSKETKP